MFRVVIACLIFIVSFVDNYIFDKVPYFKDNRIARVVAGLVLMISGSTLVIFEYRDKRTDITKLNAEIILLRNEIVAQNVSDSTWNHTMLSLLSDNYELTNRTKLAATFPLGYSVFSVDLIRKRITTSKPLKSIRVGNWTIALPALSLLRASDTLIVFRGPDRFDKSTGSRITNMTTSILINDRSKGAVPYPVVHGEEPFEMNWEIVNVTKFGIVVVFGVSARDLELHEY